MVPIGRPLAHNQTSAPFIELLHFCLGQRNQCGQQRTRSGRRYPAFMYRSSRHGWRPQGCRIAYVSLVSMRRNRY